MGSQYRTDPKVAELQAVEGYLQQSIGTPAGTATVT